ncbi:MAG: hypothetical protein CMK59_03445, partial [Proteobacteria bacterium]|nr:hypothetical protein [Pseudomonadota bacterium]
MRNELPMFGVLSAFILALISFGPNDVYLGQTIASVGCVVIVFLVMFNLGCWIAQKSREPLDWDEALFMGFSAISTVLFLCWWSGLSWIATPMLLIGLWFFWQPLDWVYSIRIHWVVLCAVAFGLFQALSPAIDTDSVYYHLAIPQKMAQSGELVGGYMQPNGSRPALLASIDGWLWMWGEQRSIPLFRVGLTSIMLVSFFKRSKSMLGLLVLLGSYSFVLEMGGTGQNIPAALGCWLTWWASRKRKWWVVAIFAGTTLSIKYTSLGVLIGIWLFGMERYSARSRFKSAGVVGMFLAIWGIRNALEGLSPVFPYSGWSESFQSLEKYGMGRDLKSLLLLPWNLLVYARPDSYTFLGVLHPIWIALPFFFIRIQRRLWLVILCGWVFFVLGPHWIRHLVPLLPLAALGFASWKPKSIQWVFVVFVWLVGLPRNWGPLAEDIELRMEATLSEQAAQKLRLKIPGWTAAQWASNNTSKDSKWAVLFSWAGLGLERRFILGSV